jgi:hypothetical protein
VSGEGAEAKPGLTSGVPATKRQNFPASAEPMAGRDGVYPCVLAVRRRFLPRSRLLVPRTMATPSVPSLQQLFPAVEAAATVALFGTAEPRMIEKNANE